MNFKSKFFMHMSNKILAITLIFSLAILGTSAYAADSASVSATVTAQNVSLTVSDGSISYGTLALGGSKSTIDLTDTQTVTNNGNVTEDFDIKGSNSAGDVWTIVDADPGTDDYMHAFSINSGSDWTYMSEDYKALTTSVSPSSTTPLDLRITTPSSTSVFTEQTVSVTILATAS